jgi:hypothetical protein
MSGPILEAQLKTWSWELGPSSILVNGDFEGAAGPPPAGWSQVNGLATRESGARTGGTGLYVCRVSYSTAASGYAYQAAGLNLSPYRITGWTRGDGTAIPFVGKDGGAVFVGTASTAWQQYSADFFYTSGNTIYLYCNNLVAGRYVEFDDTTLIPFYARTPNLGSLRTAVQLGNGVTPSSLPTLLTGTRGFQLSAASAQTFQWYQALSNGTYTVALTFSHTNSPAGNGYIFDARDSGGAGYALIGPGAVLSQSTGVTYLNGRPISAGVDIVPYGPINTLVCAGITLSIASRLVIGAHNSASTFLLNSKFYNVSIYPGTLTPTQARSYHERQMAILRY